MFIPIRDDNSLKSIPFQYVTVSLIALNVLVFLLEVGGMSESAVASFGGHAARAVRRRASRRAGRRRWRR